MHMADALVVPAVAGTMYVCSTVAAGYSVKKVRLEQEPKKIPVMGVMGAFVFAAQMINFTIPGTGSSGHIGGGILLAALLGPYAGFLTMISILLIQALLFADGGLLALGCNIWNMAFYSCFLGYFLIYRPITKNGYSKIKIVLASVLASVISLQFGAFSVTLETLLSGITELPFGAFVASMQPIHLVIGAIEGFITAAILLFVYEARPELMRNTVAQNKMSYKQILLILSVITILIGGGLSLFASSNPDGLEWSIARVSGQEEVESKGNIYSKAEDIQEKTAILPDYSFGENVEGFLGTSFSGVLGSGLVVFVCIGGSLIFRAIKRREKAEEPV